MNQKEHEEKLAELYRRQKELLDQFLSNGAISRAQYNKSLGDLTAKMEMLDIVGPDGEPTGDVVVREKAHEEGILHRTSHVWLLRRVPAAGNQAGYVSGCSQAGYAGNGQNFRLQVLLQKRSANKDSFPGCYDISSAGHIPAGKDFKESAVRELKEELGVDVSPEDLIFCGDRTIIVDDVFYGKPFHDRQYSRVFFIWCSLDEKDFALQQEEVESVLWMDFGECMAAVKNSRIPNCIYVEELEMVERAVTGSIS